MKLYPFLETLDKLREKIGAPKIFGEYTDTLPPFKAIQRKLRTTGIEIRLEEISTVGPFLTYENEHLVILYIKNSNSSKFDLENNSAERDTPKFHFTWCNWIDDKYKEKRLDRYVVSQSESNLFTVVSREKENNKRQELTNVRLFPCQRCLGRIGYKGFKYVKGNWSERIEIVKAFSVKDFLDENYGNLTVLKHIPKFSANDNVSGTYTDDFIEISRRLRERCNWTCSKCGIDMSRRKDGLHCHHINGVKGDNSLDNLQVLCAVCHRGIDQYHRGMKINPDIEQFIKQNRADRF